MAEQGEYGDRLKRHSKADAKVKHPQLSEDEKYSQSEIFHTQTRACSLWLITIKQEHICPRFEGSEIVT